MTLAQLANKLEALCRDGHSLAEVIVRDGREDGSIFNRGIKCVTIAARTGNALIVLEDEEDEDIVAAAKVLKAVPEAGPGGTKFIECPLCGAEHDHAKRMVVSRRPGEDNLRVKCADCGFSMGARG